MNTKSSKPVLHTVITADGVTHSRKSPRHYAVAIIIESHPVLSNQSQAKDRRLEAARYRGYAEKYELQAKTAPAVETEIKVPSGYGWDRTETLWTAEKLMVWVADYRAKAIEMDALAAEADRRAADPATKPTFWCYGWSQTEAQGHKTASTVRKKVSNGSKVYVIPATRHG
jgi:hypothetical protein